MNKLIAITIALVMALAAGLLCRYFIISAAPSGPLSFGRLEETPSEGDK